VTNRWVINASPLILLGKAGQSLAVLAKRRGFLPAVRPVFDRLQMAGLFVTPALVEQVAKAAGE